MCPWEHLCIHSGENQLSPCNIKADDKGVGLLGAFRESYMNKMSTFKYHFKD